MLIGKKKKKERSFFCIAVCHFERKKKGLIVSAVYNGYILREVHFSDLENSAFLLVVVSIVCEQWCIQQ